MALPKEIYSDSPIRWPTAPVISMARAPPIITRMTARPRGASESQAEVYPAKPSVTKVKMKVAIYLEAGGNSRIARFFQKNLLTTRHREKGIPTTTA